MATPTAIRANARNRSWLMLPILTKWPTARITIPLHVTIPKTHTVHLRKTLAGIVIHHLASPRRRKPGACSNTLAQPMAFADQNVLDMLDGEVLGTKFINELLSMVHQGESENLGRLAAGRDRLQGEIEKLVGSIAMGQAPASIVSAIRERELEVARLEARLRAPRKEAPNLEKLREALKQRAEEWRHTLRSEPKVARLLIRRLIGPLELYDASKPEWQMPGFIKADCVVKTGLIDGLAEIHDVASPAAFAGDVSKIQDVASPSGSDPLWSASIAGDMRRAA